MLRVARDFLINNNYPEDVVFCLYGEEAYSVFKKTLDRLFV